VGGCCWGGGGAGEGRPPHVTAAWLRAPAAHVTPSCSPHVYSACSAAASTDTCPVLCPAAVDRGSAGADGAPQPPLCLQAGDADAPVAPLGCPRVGPHPELLLGGAAAASSSLASVVMDGTSESFCGRKSGVNCGMTACATPTSVTCLQQRHPRCPKTNALTMRVLPKQRWVVQ
jgi:hypothetical protein